MIDDILYKLLRKTLHPHLYHRISRSVLGRGKRYHQAPTYLNIYEHYRNNGLRFNGKVVLELGSGDQYYTALSFLSSGAKQVLLVDPVLSPKSFTKDLETLGRITGCSLPPDAGARITCCRSIQDVPSEYNDHVDIICSHNVLEHFSDLESFFAHNQRLLANSGISYNRVDLSDHTYHVFVKFKLTRAINQRRGLHHLRYSNKTFQLLNDPKCYMNRRLLPTYLELAKRHHLDVRELQTIPFRQVPIHSDLYSGPLDAEKLFITAFSIKFGKKATM